MLLGSQVAPLAGSVDRNNWLNIGKQVVTASLPSRGAWIEILGSSLSGLVENVAPLAGSVDRNIVARDAAVGGHCRSPRGERG